MPFGETDNILGVVVDVIILIAMTRRALRMMLEKDDFRWPRISS
jgi:hypothetical protein